MRFSRGEGTLSGSAAKGVGSIVLLEPGFAVDQFNLAAMVDFVMIDIS